jgi:hypothetical protein
MALISKPKTFAANAVAVSADVNSDFDTIYNDYNGNITNANIAASAAIADTKLATISTGAKVNISALTATSQATGDVMYASNASTYARLGIGTYGQVLRVNSGATAPEWGALPPGTLASAAEVKTGTDTEKAVPTASIIGHEGVAKGWAVFAPIGGTGAITAADSFNVSGITDNGTGDFTIAWDTDFGSANYAVASACLTSGTVFTHIVARAAGTVQINTVTSTNGTVNDPTDISIIALGDR